LDNLKKLLINATSFPGMSGIERAWREAAELAADDSAVENGGRARSRVRIDKSFPIFATMVRTEVASGLVCASSVVSLRVQRLLEWHIRPRIQEIWAWILPSLLIVNCRCEQLRYSASC